LTLFSIDQCPSQLHRVREDEETRKRGQCIAARYSVHARKVQCSQKIVEQLNVRSNIARPSKLMRNTQKLSRREEIGGEGLHKCCELVSSRIHAKVMTFWRGPSAGFGSSWFSVWFVWISSRTNAKCSLLFGVLAQVESTASPPVPVRGVLANRPLPQHHHIPHR